MNTIFLDIETERFFGDRELAAMPREAQLMAIDFGLAVTYTDNGGWKTWLPEDALHLWCVLTIPTDVESLTVVGYNIQQFDLPIIYRAAAPAGPVWPRVIDLFEQIKTATGRWPKLDDVAAATLGQRKTADGKQAAAWLRDGEIERVVEYCRQDVQLVRDLWTHAEQGHPLILPAQPRYKQEHTIRLWLDRAGQWSHYEVQR